MRALLVSLVVFLSHGCSSEDPEAAENAHSVSVEWTEGVTSRESAKVRWRPRGGPLPLNVHFPLELELHDPESGAALTGAQLAVRCDMPAHGHGMNVEPQAVEEGEGRYLVDGMLLHMTGDWVLTIDVLLDGRAESVQFPIVLE